MVSHKASTVRSAVFRSNALSLENAFSIGLKSEVKGGSIATWFRPPQWRRARRVAEVVHDLDVAGPEFGNENLIDISLERLTVEEPVENRRRNHRGQAEPGGECGRAPMAMRDVGA